MFDHYFLRRFFAPASTLEAQILRFIKCARMVFCLPHRNLQNGWLSFFVVIDFKFSPNFTLKVVAWEIFFVWGILVK
jgi:hypothetical protein